MKSLFKIYRRYILSAGWIAAVVILVNMCVMMMVGTYFASQNRENPDSVGRRRIMEVSSHPVSYTHLTGTGTDGW